MKTFTQWIKSLFTHSESKAIESFLNSKNPSNPAELEHWLRVYQNTNKGMWA